MEVSIKMTGVGLDFNSTISLYQAAQIMAALSKPDQDINVTTPHTTKDIQELGEAPTTDEEPSSKETSPFESPREAIDALKASTFSKKIIAVAMYMGATSQNNMLVNISEVITEITKAGEPKPTQIPREVKKAVTAGYIYLEDKNQFRLLAPVDTIKKDNFAKFKKGKSSSTTKKAGKKREKLVVRAEVAGMSFSTNIEKYQDYFSIKGIKDRMLWLIKYGQAATPGGLNRLEIMHISKMIGGEIAPSAFSVYQQKNIKDGHLAQVNTKLILTTNGEKYLKESFGT